MKEFHQRMIFIIQLIINQEQIDFLSGKKMNLELFKELSLDIKLSEKTGFYIFEESKPNTYEKIIMTANKYKDEKFSVEIFKSISKKESLNSLSRITCKSIFTEREILIEKLNLNYEVSMEQIQKELKEEIQFLIKAKYAFKDLFFQIDNKLYRCSESYDVFIKEIMKLILLFINKNNTTINNLKTEIQQNEIKNNEIEDITESETKEKEKNIIKSSANLDIKEALTQIIEKEKKIKELELKLSRYPFELNEGEELMTVIIKSSDDKINVPIICKNTFVFNRLEEKVYKIYKEYLEKDNIFMLNGKIINKCKTLEKNGIKDKDIIIMKSNE